MHLAQRSLVSLLAVTCIFTPECRAQAAPPAVASAGLVRAAFWNIRWFPGGRPNASRNEQSRQIRSVHTDVTKLNADVIGFEEVRDWESAALAIQPLSGFKVDVCSTFPAREGQTETQQVAIVSRLQPISAWAEPWQAGSAITPPRGFAFAAYELAPRKLLCVYGLHLKSNRGELVEDIAIREESMRQLRSHLRAMEQAYGTLGQITWLIGGDFNTAPDDERFKAEKTTRDLSANGFSWIWEHIPMPQRITLPPDTRFPAACFDHMFFRGAKLNKAEVSRPRQVPATTVRSEQSSRSLSPRSRAALCSDVSSIACHPEPRRRSRDLAPAIIGTRPSRLCGGRASRLLCLHPARRPVAAQARGPCSEDLVRGLQAPPEVGALCSSTAPRATTFPLQCPVISGCEILRRASPASG